MVDQALGVRVQKEGRQRHELFPATVFTMRAA